MFEKALRRAKRENNKADIEYFEEQIKIRFNDLYLVNGFAHPQVIIYKNNAPFIPKLSTWGLVPKWANNPEEIWNKTLNARAETIFNKASFKESAQTKRCLIPTDGYYDHHELRGKKYPYYIFNKKDEPLYFAGIWNEWINHETGEVIDTFSIITTEANSLLKKIHNKPHFSKDSRMPAILHEAELESWLNPQKPEELIKLLKPYPDSELNAFTVRPLTGKNAAGNSPEACIEFEYPELSKGNDQLALFA